MSADAAALVAAAREGRELRYGAEPPSKQLAERMLGIPTGVLRAARGRNPALAAIDLDRAIERVEHEWIGQAGQRLHLEAITAEPGAPSFVIVHGLGDHARRLLPLAAALAEHGYNTLALDRRGHGLSEGPRGDSTLEQDLDAIERGVAVARTRFDGPVVVCGDSLGGIVTWYMLTREPAIDAAVCHCIRHPEVDPNLAFRVKKAGAKLLAAVAPTAQIPVRQIADYDHVALDPETKRYFDSALDKLFNFTLTARASASQLRFRPPRDWSEVTIPVLVVIGAQDRMVTPEYTRRCFERAAPPGARYLEVPGAGHQLFLDDLALVLPELLEWAAATVGAPAAARGA